MQSLAGGSGAAGARAPRWLEWWPAASRAGEILARRQALPGPARAALVVGHGPPCQRWPNIPAQVGILARSTSECLPWVARPPSADCGIRSQRQICRCSCPPSLYHLPPAQPCAEAGQALVDLAANSRPPAAPARRSVRVAHAADLGRAPQRLQRSARLHGGYLARAHPRHGDLEQACVATQTALTRLPEVPSGRCRSLLARLRQQFARR